MSNNHAAIKKCKNTSFKIEVPANGVPQLMAAIVPAQLCVEADFKKGMSNRGAIFCQIIYDVSASTFTISGRYFDSEQGQKIQSLLLQIIREG